MTEYTSIDQLIAGDLDLAGEDVQLPSGGVVRLRGLTRGEMLLNGKNTEDVALIEARNVSTCLIEPRMTLAQVQAWQKKSRAGGDLGVLSKKIRELSNYAEGAAKSDVDAAGD